MSIEDLEEAIVKWGEERKIFTEGTLMGQVSKAQEELNELKEGVEKRDIGEVEDAIGDIMVCLTMVAEMHGLRLRHCYGRAYNEIKDRKGEMRNGVFVKEEDL